jgi:hypothetical protein
MVLRDNTAPVVTMGTSFTMTESQYAGTATITDNVDLIGWDRRLRFDGGVILPVAPMTVVGSFGPENRVGSVSASGQTVLWRSLRTGTGPAATDGDLGGAPVQLTGVGFGAIDMGRNFGSGFETLVGVVGNAMPAGLTAMRISIADSPNPPLNTFCNNVARPSGDGGLANCAVTNQGTAPVQRQVTASAVGTTGFAVPFTAVHFYRVDRFGNIWHIGTSTTPMSGSVGAEFQHRWAITADASRWQGSIAANDQGLFAVGVSADRDAFRSPTQAITVRGAARQPMY